LTRKLSVSRCVSRRYHTASPASAQPPSRTFNAHKDAMGGCYGVLTRRRDVSAEEQRPGTPDDAIEGVHACQRVL
jgi:hypothetical protein